jgi:hypothetical protein
MEDENKHRKLYELLDSSWNDDFIPKDCHWFSKEMYEYFGIEVLSLYCGEKLELGKNLFIN